MLVALEQPVRIAHGEALGIRPIHLAVPQQPPRHVSSHRPGVRVRVQRLVPKVVDVVCPGEVPLTLGAAVPAKPIRAGRPATTPVVEQPPVEPIPFVVGDQIGVREAAGQETPEKQMLGHDGAAGGLGLVPGAQVAAVELASLREEVPDSCPCR